MTNTIRALARLGLVGLQVSLAVMVAACGAGSGLAPARRELAAKPLPPRAGGLDKADLAPDFALPDINGRLVRLADLLQTHHAVVLVFYPGDYCQLCLNLLTDLEQHRLEFEQRRAQIVAVAYESSADAASTYTATGARYPVLADVGRRLAAHYGVQPLLPGRTKHGLGPVTVFILGQDGRPVWNSRSGSGTAWPSSEVILANLKLTASGK
jgi:peroxiredoxin Q/BCP